MVMLRFTLHSFQLNLTLDMFHIQTPLQSNQFMIMKWTISWNYSTQNTMKIFWVLTYRCFRLDLWSPLIQHFIQSLLSCFINTEEQILQSQISCHPQGFSWRSTYHTQNNFDYLQIDIFKVNPQRDSNIVVPNVCSLSKNNLSAYSSSFWSCLYYQTKTNDKKRTHGTSPIKYPWLGRTLNYLYIDQGIKFPEVQPMMYQILPLVSSSAFWSCLYYQTKTNG